MIVFFIFLFHFDEYIITVFFTTYYWQVPGTDSDNTFVYTMLYEILFYTLCNINYLLPESEVFTGKPRTETPPHRPSDSEVNTARPRLDILPQRPNVRAGFFFAIFVYRTLTLLTVLIL